MTTFGLDTGRWLVTLDNGQLWELDTTPRTETGAWTATSWDLASWSEPDGDFLRQWWVVGFEPVASGQHLDLIVCSELLGRELRAGGFVTSLTQLAPLPLPSAPCRVTTESGEVWTLSESRGRWHLHLGDEIEGERIECVRCCVVGRQFIVGLARPHDRCPSPHWWSLGVVTSIEEIS